MARKTDTPSKTEPVGWLTMRRIKMVIIVALMMNLVTGAFYLGTLSNKPTIKRQSSQLKQQSGQIDKLVADNDKSGQDLKSVADKYNTLKGIYDQQTTDIKAGKYTTTQYVPTYIQSRVPQQIYCHTSPYVSGYGSTTTCF